MAITIEAKMNKEEVTRECKVRGIFISRFLDSCYSFLTIIESRSEDANKILKWTDEDSRVEMFS
jgi:hypothetical protein